MSIRFTLLTNEPTFDLFLSGDGDGDGDGFGLIFGDGEGDGKGVGVGVAVALGVAFTLATTAGCLTDRIFQATNPPNNNAPTIIPANKRIRDAVLRWTGTSTLGKDLLGDNKPV